MSAPIYRATVTKPYKAYLWHIRYDRYVFPNPWWSEYYGEDHVKPILYLPTFTEKGAVRKANRTIKKWVKEDNFKPPTVKVMGSPRSKNVVQ